MITEIWGARPESATFSKKIRPKPPSAAAPSCRRAPADSMKPTSGTPTWRLWRSAAYDHLGLGHAHRPGGDRGVLGVADDRAPADAPPRRVHPTSVSAGSDAGSSGSRLRGSHSHSRRWRGCGGSSCEVGEECDRTDKRRAPPGALETCRPTLLPCAVAWLPARLAGVPTRGSRVQVRVAHTAWSMRFAPSCNIVCRCLTTLSAWAKVRNVRGLGCFSDRMETPTRRAHIVSISSCCARPARRTPLFRSPAVVRARSASSTSSLARRPRRRARAAAPPLRARARSLRRAAGRRRDARRGARRATDGLDTIAARKRARRTSCRRWSASCTAPGLQAYVVATALAEAARGAGRRRRRRDRQGARGGRLDRRGRLVRALPAAARGRSPSPVYVHGGIGDAHGRGGICRRRRGRGARRAAAARARVAAAERLQAALAGADGSETATLGAELGAPFRAYSRPGMHSLELLRDVEQELLASADARVARGARPSARTSPAPADGRSCAAARAGRRLRRPRWHERFETVAGIARRGLRAAIASRLRDARRGQPARGGRGRRAGAPHPLSDRAGSDDARQRPRRVRRGGRRRRRPAVPRARADARPAKPAPLLEHTAELLGERSWGVGCSASCPPSCAPSSSRSCASTGRRSR